MLVPVVVMFRVNIARPNTIITYETPLTLSFTLTLRLTELNEKSPASNSFAFRYISHIHHPTPKRTKIIAGEGLLLIYTGSRHARRTKNTLYKRARVHPNT